MQRILTVKEAAEVLQVTTTTIYNLYRRGELSLIKVGVSSRITEEELERFIKTHTVQKTKPENKEAQK